MPANPGYVPWAAVIAQPPLARRKRTYTPRDDSCATASHSLMTPLCARGRYLVVSSGAAALAGNVASAEGFVVARPNQREPIAT